MAGTTRKSAFWRGFKLGVPFTFVIVPFGMLFGVVATEAGLDLWSTMGFSALVIAGAAQFTALTLLSEDAATWLVIVTALAVNLRMAMYSAALVPHLGSAPLWKRACASYLMVDQTYAGAISVYEVEPDMPLGAKLALFFGVAAPIVPLWYVATLGGALVGSGRARGMGIGLCAAADLHRDVGTDVADTGPYRRGPGQYRAVSGSGGASGGRRAVAGRGLRPWARARPSRPGRSVGHERCTGLDRHHSSRRRDLSDPLFRFWG